MLCLEFSMLKKGQIRVIFNTLQNKETLKLSVLSTEIPHEFCKFHDI